MDVVIEAGTFPACAISETLVAGRELEHPAGLVHRLLHRGGADIGPQIPGAVVQLDPGLRDSGKGRRGNADIMVALVILEQNIIFGRILLD